MVKFRSSVLVTRQRALEDEMELRDDPMYGQDLENRIQHELDRRRQVVHDLKEQIVKAERDVDLMVKLFGVYIEWEHYANRKNKM